MSDRDMAALDELVERGEFATRSEALRAGLRLLLKEQREREIEEAYRRGYGKYPQEDWIGEAGLALFAARALAEEAGKDPL